MSRSSARRGQVEPIAALVAVLAVGAGLGIYAGVLESSLPGDRPRDVATPTLERVESAVADRGVYRPDALGAAPGVAPTGYRANVTLVADGRRWRVGPPRPAGARVASERVSVRVGPGRVRPGRVTVAVWR